MVPKAGTTRSRILRQTRMSDSSFGMASSNRHESCMLAAGCALGADDSMIADIVII
jgi:hypothetical protein